MKTILPNEGMARFALKPTPTPVLNAFVPLDVLQTRLGLKGRANLLLLAAASPAAQANLQKHLTLDDWVALSRR